MVYARAVDRGALSTSAQDVTKVLRAQHWCICSHLTRTRQAPFAPKAILFGANEWPLQAAAAHSRPRSAGRRLDTCSKCTIKGHHPTSHQTRLS